MQRSLLLTSGIALSLVLSACGSSTGANPGPGQPDPGDPGGPGTSECRVTVTDDITIPTAFVNGPEECDYFFPGTDRQYRVTAPVTVEPGTVLRFGRDVILMVTDSGSLMAVGEPDNRIRFEGQLNTTGFWYGICFADNRESRLENVDVVWAGKVYIPSSSSCRGAVSGAISDSEPVHIVNTVVFGSHTNGLNAHDLILGDFRNNAFGGNDDYGVIIDAEQVAKLDRGSDYLGDTLGQANGRPFIHAAGTINTPGEVFEWHTLNAPYVIEDYSLGYSSGLFIEDTAILVLHEGVDIRFGPDALMSVWDGAGLAAIGTDSAPVVLRGTQDTPGAWPGIWVNTAMLELRNVRIMNAGQAGNIRSAALGIDGVYDVLPKWINGLHIEGSTACGLDIRDPSLFEEFENVTYANNAVDYCGN